MTVRFLTTQRVVLSPLRTVTYPAGKVVNVTEVTPQVAAWLKAGVIEAVRESEPELATVAARERAVTRRAKRAE
jgi:hypothetical protein